MLNTLFSSFKSTGIPFTKGKVFKHLRFLHTIVFSDLESAVKQIGQTVSLINS